MSKFKLFSYHIIIHATYYNIRTLHRLKNEHNLEIYVYKHSCIQQLMNKEAINLREQGRIIRDCLEGEM